MGFEPTTSHFSSPSLTQTCIHFLNNINVVEGGASVKFVLSKTKFSIEFVIYIIICIFTKAYGVCVMFHFFQDFCVVLVDVLGSVWDHCWQL